MFTSHSFIQMVRPCTDSDAEDSGAAAHKCEETLVLIRGGVMSLRVPTSLRLWTICVSRDMTSGTRRDAQGRSSKKGGKMISTTH